MTVGDLLRSIPSKDRLKNLRTIREKVVKIRDGRAQAAVLGSECAPKEIRWLAARPVGLIKEYLSRFGERDPITTCMAEEQIVAFITYKMKKGRVALRTAADQISALQREMKALAEETHATNVPSLFRTLATLTPVKASPPLSKDDVLRMMSSASTEVAALASILHLSAGRGAEVRDMQLSDIETAVSPDGTEELVLKLRNKKRKDCYLHPIPLPLNSVFGRAITAHLRDMAQTGVEEGDVFSAGAWRQLGDHLPEGAGIRSFRRGKAQEEAPPDLMAEKAAKTLRHTNTRTQRRYRHVPLPPFLPKLRNLKRRTK